MPANISDKLLTQQPARRLKTMAIIAWLRQELFLNSLIAARRFPLTVGYAITADWETGSLTMERGDRRIKVYCVRLSGEESLRNLATLLLLP